MKLMSIKRLPRLRIDAPSTSRTVMAEYDEILVWVNPSLYEPIKRRVIASFDKYDLSSAERDLDYAEKKASRLNTEYSDAGKKYERALGMSMSFLSAFTSDEKLEQLYRKVQRVQEEESEAWGESVDLGVKCRKLKALLEQQPIVQSEINGIVNGGLVFS